MVVLRSCMRACLPFLPPLLAGLWVCTQVSEPPAPVTYSPPAPSPHEVNVWGGDGQLAISRDAWLAKATQTGVLRIPTPRASSAEALTAGVGAGFTMVGSVAVLEGDDLTAVPNGSGFGLDKDSLAEVSRRFIAAFGDNYDQIAVFLGFTDRLSQQSLAYQQPVKNSIKGLGLGFWDESARFGSASGRMESVLNMKRINIYGRDAANDPENDLYSVWAQEAAHRWGIFFKYRFKGDVMDRGDLLLRQNAHWAPWVQAEGSFLDGFSWQDNGDGTFSVIDSNKRYGTMDQYAMGLRTADEVPPFFLLDDFKDEAGAPVARTNRFARGVKYKARRINITVDDVIRAVGPREPALSPAALDLRMGVIFLTPPGQGLTPLIGEAFRVETTRAPWDDFYNASVGGRGKVCTALLHPCRGPAFTFGAPKVTGPGGSDLAAPGQTLALTVPLVNVGTEPGVAAVTVSGNHPLLFENTLVTSASVAPGGTSTVTFSAQVPMNVACGLDFKLDFEAPGRLGPSKGTRSVRVGVKLGPGSDLEDSTTATTWQINPDGTDTAKVGAWEWGTPEKTEAFDFVLQPAGAFSGVKAFVTGAAKGPSPESNDLDFDSAAPTVAQTTLQSPPLPLSDLVNPRLSYQLHFVAAGFQKEVLVPGPGDAFYVQASIDGGPWVEVDRVPSSLFLAWENRLVSLSVPLGAALVSGAQLRLRFIAEDSAQSETVVEAVVDDVFLTTDMPGCGNVVSAPDGGATPGAGVPAANHDDGCSCTVGRARSPRYGLPLLIAAAFSGLALLRRRHLALKSWPKVTKTQHKRNSPAMARVVRSKGGEGVE